LIGRLARFLSTSSLSFRLGSTLVLALVPLGVLSVVQTQHAQREVSASTLEGVAGASRMAVQDQIDLIEDAQISARVLAAALSFAIDEGATCVGRVKAVAQGIPQATLVAYIPLSGLMTCSSTDQVYDFGDNPLFQRMIARPLPSIVYNPSGPVSGTAVIGIGHPVFDRAGSQIGVVSISLPYTTVAPKEYSDPVALWEPTYLATFLGDGTVLLSSDPGRDLSEVVPKGVSVTELVGRAGTPAYTEGSNGQQILAVTPVARDLFLLSIWQREAVSLFSPASPAAPYLLPILTWIAALVAAAFASGRLVVRHVRALARSMTNYMTTKARPRMPDLSDAPAEIQRLHSVYEDLIRTIEQEEAELQNLIIDKDVLLREVNHRSGNSLQIIASVMRMYRRETADDEVRTILDGLINRVIALSSTHTSLYSMTGRRDVPMDEILSGVVRRLKEIHGVALGVAKKRFDPIRMPAEAAIPLALALAETVSCHFTSRSVAAEGVDISLIREDDSVRLTVAGPIVPEFRPEALTGLVALPRRMLTQFAIQLRGKVTIRVEGNRSIVELTLPHSA
jgi:two-component sensor histidine kinase